MILSIGDLAKKMNAHLVGKPSQEIDVQSVSIDSRSMKNSTHTLFFALKGRLNDGHCFVEDLQRRGVRFFVVERMPKTMAEDVVYFLVPDVKKAFQMFAQYYRELFDLPIIGVTGSNGKTIVKEWLSFLLSDVFGVIKNPKSYNSQIGVPLSLIEINQQHNLGIFEAGISTTNEMESLAQMIQPTIGILTNIGSAHDEGFASLNEKLEEKLKLFSNAEKVILPNNEWIWSQVPKEKRFVWGFSSICDVFFEKIDTKHFIVHFEKNTFEIELPFEDWASIYNGLICVATLLFLGIDTEQIQEKIGRLPKLHMRLEVKKGRRDCLLIDDCYSSDYQSLTIALDFLYQQNHSAKKTIILSDILQSGLSQNVLYERVANLLKKYQISKAIGIGAEISAHLPNHIQGVFFERTQDFLNQYNLDSFQNEAILIKGSRIFSFEKIVEELEEKTHETILEVNLDAITHNFYFYKNLCAPQTKIMAMIKANAYGYGSCEIAKHLEHLRVDFLGVAFADEGVQLRKYGILTPIVVMNPEVSVFQQMIHYELQPEIYSLKELAALVALLKKDDKKAYPIHLKLNTGMNRLGFREEELSQLVEVLQRTPEVQVVSIFSHLATADDPKGRDFTLQQINHFEKMYDRLSDALKLQPIKHILNSSGIYNFKEYSFDLVRLGIGLYGLGNSEEEQQQLETVSELKTRVLQVYEISPDDTVGYGRMFQPKEKTQIAVLPIGYADGIRRSYGNGLGSVYIQRKKYPIAGNICMDMLMIDVGLDNIQEGDEAEIFGKNITVKEIAKKWNTISYEVITAISQRVKRIFYKE